MQTTRATLAHLAEVTAALAVLADLGALPETCFDLATALESAWRGQIDGNLPPRLADDSRVRPALVALSGALLGLGASAACEYEAAPVGDCR